MMSQDYDVVLMTGDAAVSAAVDTAMAPHARAWSNTTVGSWRELVLTLGRDSGPVVLVDLDPDPRQTLVELERLTARFPHPRFVALAPTLESDLLLAAMQSGVRHVLLKQTIATELPVLLQRLIAGSARSSASAERGNLIIVLSAGGGSGATLLATNLANELALESRQTALLGDLDAAYGTVATYLGVEAQYGIDHLLSYEGQVDSALVASTAVAFNERLHVLPSPASVNFSSPGVLAWERLEQVLEAMSEAYRWVVIDAPRVSMDVAAMLANAATRTLLTLQPTVKDARVARGILGALAERGVGNDAVLPVVSRYAKRQHRLTLPETSEALGGLAVECVRSDYQAAARAMDFGQLLADAAPRSSVRQDVQGLAKKLLAAVPAMAAERRDGKWR